MLKHKKFLSLLLIAPLFSIASCQKVSETYSVIKHDQDGNKLGYTLPPTWDEVHKAPFDLEFDELVVKYDNIELTKRVTSLDEAKSDNLTYFISTNESTPSKSIISNFHINKTDAQENTTLTFYLAHIDYKGESKDSIIHLSEKITIKVYNQGAYSNVWIVPVVSSVVVLLAVGMVFFTHRYKAKKEGKI